MEGQRPRNQPASSDSQGRTESRPGLDDRKGRGRSYRDRGNSLAALAQPGEPKAWGGPQRDASVPAPTGLSGSRVGAAGADWLAGARAGRVWWNEQILLPSTIQSPCIESFFEVAESPYSLDLWQY